MGVGYDDDDDNEDNDSGDNDDDAMQHFVDDTDVRRSNTITMKMALTVTMF